MDNDLTLLAKYAAKAIRFQMISAGKVLLQNSTKCKEETGSPHVMYDGTSPVLHYCKVYKGFIYIEYAVNQYVSELCAATEERHKDSLGHKKLIVVLSWPSCLTPISLDFLG